MKNTDILFKLMNADIPIYIWGYGEFAILSFQYLEKKGISVDGFVIDSKYSDDVKMKSNASNHSVYIVENLLNSIPKFVIIKGFWDAIFMTEQEIIKHFNDQCDGAYFLAEVYSYDDEIFSKEFYQAHLKDFMEVRSALNDELSVKSLDAYINCKVNQDNDYLIPLFIQPQYFFTESFISYGNNEVLIDCGAYDGDSIRDFLALVHNKYDMIYAFEPEEKMIKKLKKYIKDNCIDNVNVIEKGAYSYSGKVCFKDDGVGGHIIDCGEYVLDVDTIDHVVKKERVTYIKMDIEKSEGFALAGAKKTIIREHPVLAVSVYHKTEDIFSIYRQIKNYYNGYKFFFRCHKPMAIDAVLYAVPPERIVECS